MSKKDKFFNKVKLGEKESKITAAAISEKHLITGEVNGTVTCYEILNKKVNPVKEQSGKNKIDKILIPPNRKIAFILTGGEVILGNIPSFSNYKQLIKKDVADMYINTDDPQCDNILLVITKRKKVKLYDFEYSNGNGILTEQKKDTITLEEIPTCGVWTDNNNFIYSYGSKTFWVDINSGKSNLVEFDRAVQIINLGGKIALSNTEMTLFMKDGKAFSFNPILHQGTEFQGYSEFKNHLIGLYKNSVHIFKKGEQTYDFVENIDFSPAEGTGKFLVTSNYKVIVITESVNGTKFNVFDFQEKPYEEQIKVLIDQKLYDNGLEKLIQNVPEDDETKPNKIENFFLDCAWACIEGDKKDYDKSIKYISLTNFNPFEFIYMFYDSLSVNIIHSDKKQDIIDHRKENQLLGFSSNTEDQNKAFSFLISILTMKRDYILEKFNSNSAEYEKKQITFMSSKRSKINLSDSTTPITVRNTLDSINSALIKSMIKVSRSPRDIELVLDNKSIDYDIFKDFEEDIFFTDEKNKNLDETKFTLAYIAEKKGDYETALKEWENFGNNKPSNDKFAIIGRERTKKIFYKFKESKSTDKNNKEQWFRTYIKWLLIKYPNEAFEVIIKTELVTNKVFIEDIIPEVEKQSSENKIESGTLKEKFLEYCNENQPSESYQTNLLQLYADKLFSYKEKTSLPGKLQGDLKKYHDAFMKVIQAPKSCYNKRAILEYIEGSWLKEPRKYLYSQLKEHDRALNELFNDAKTNLSFADLEKYCQENIKTKPDIFQNFYKLLSDYVKNDCQGIIDKDNEEIEKINKKLTSKTEYVTDHEKESFNKKIDEYKDEIKRLEELKKPYEQEMLKILKQYGSIQNIDPLFALNYANENWNICESNDFFNYLLNVVRDYTVEGNKYKIGKNLSEMGLVYKEKEAYEYKKKYVTIDSEKTCDLCKKKIGNTIFVVYPNLRVYHSKCAVNHSIDPMTGVDFSKKRYVE